MVIQKFEIQGPLLIEPRIFEDQRGFFTERYVKSLFFEHGIKIDFSQDNYSRSGANVLRGMHFQFEPAQHKLVTCLRGAIQDIVVDIRKDSPTFGQHIDVILREEKPQWLLVPVGFAHGFCVLSSDGADVLYKVDSPYNPKGEIGLKWNDPDLNLPWKIEAPVLSPKDDKGLLFKDYSKNPVF